MPSYTLINNTASSLPLGDSTTLPPGGERVVAQISREMRRLEEQAYLTIFEILEQDWSDPRRYDYFDVVDPLTTRKATEWVMEKIAAGGGGTGGGTGGDLNALLPAPDGSVPEYQNVGNVWRATVVPRSLLLDGGNF